jgi:hypothetical protein
MKERKGETKRQAVLEKRGKTARGRRETERQYRKDEKLADTVKSTTCTLHSTCLVKVFLHRGAGDIPAVKHAGTHTTQGPTTIAGHR